MNVTPISKKIKYTLFISMIFLAIVLVAMYINMPKTVVDSQKETLTLTLLKDIEDILINVEQAENNKIKYAETKTAFNLENYKSITYKLSSETAQLIKAVQLYNFETTNILLLSDAINKKIFFTNKVVENVSLNENNKAQMELNDSMAFIEMQTIYLLSTGLQKNAINFLKQSTNVRKIYTRSLISWFIVLVLLFFLSSIFTYLHFKKHVVTTQKLNSLLLHNSTLLQNISAAIVTTNREGKIIDWNVHAEAIYGYNATEAVGNFANELFKVAPIKTTEKDATKSSEEEKAWEGETIHYHKNGTAIHVDVRKALIKNSEDQFTTGISIIRDITSKVELEKKLNLLTETLQEKVNRKTAELDFFFENIADSFIVFDNDWNITYLNKTALNAGKVNAQDIVGKNLLHFLPDFKKEPFYVLVEEAKRLQASQRSELYYATRDRWYSILIYPYADGVSICYHDITSTKNAEIALKEAHEKLNFHINNTPLAVIEFDSEYNVVQWNKKATEIFGWTAEEVIGTGFKMRDTTYSEDVEMINAEETNVTTTDVTSNVIKTRSGTKSGKIILCEWYNSIIKDEHNNIKGILSLVKEVTEEKRIQQELINAEAKFRAIVEQSVVGIYIRKGNRLIYNNPHLAEIFGYTQKEFNDNFDLSLFIASDNKEYVKKQLKSYRKNNIFSYHFEFKGIHKTGTIIYVEMYGTHTNYNGEDAIIGTLIDITARKTADAQLRISEDALKLSNERYELVAKATNDAIWDWDIEKDILKGNESFCKIMDIKDNEEIDYESFVEKVHVNDRKRLLNNFKLAIVNQDAVINEEFRFINKNGDCKIVLDRAYIMYKNNIACRMIGSMQDITYIKQTTEKLKREKELLDNIINSLPGIFCIFTKQGEFLRWNRNFETVTGYGTEEIKYIRPTQLIAEKEKNIQLAKIENVFESGNDVGEATIVTKSGELIPYFCTGTQTNYEDEDCLIGIGLDISDKIKWQNELIERNMALRELAAHLETIRETERTHIAREIHDELGQQLTGLKMDISWLGRKINSKDESIKEKMKETIKLIDGTIITVRRIATELRPSILDDLGLIEAMEWQSEDFEKRSEIKSVFKSNVSQIKVSTEIATAIFRIFQESLTNVSKHSQATKVVSCFNLKEGNISLSIEDNGNGFDKNEIKNKKTLGLLGMKERIMLINGTYEINGNVGKGTSVIITVSLTQSKSL